MLPIEFGSAIVPECSADVERDRLAGQRWCSRQMKRPEQRQGMCSCPPQTDTRTVGRPYSTGLVSTNAITAETTKLATRQMVIAMMFHAEPLGSAYTGSEVMPGMTNPKHFTPNT